MNKVGQLIKVVGSAIQQGVHKSFRARAVHESLGEMEVHLKVLTGKRMANELVVAALAQVLGVKVPVCYAVASDKAEHVLESNHVHLGTHYFLASQLVPDAKTLQDTATLVNPVSAEAFFRSPDWQPIVLLDTLVANSDRRAANVLMDDVGGVWAIDHDTAFGADWEAVDLQATRHTTNLLARPGQSQPTQDMRHEFLERVRHRPPDLRVDDAVSRLPEIGLLTRSDARNLSLYVAQRWQNLETLLHRALFSQF